MLAFAMLAVAIAIIALANVVIAAPSTTTSETATSTTAPALSTPADTVPDSATAASVRSDSQATASTTLERMARAHFGELGAAELQFVRHAPYRDLVWSSPSSDPDTAINDPSRGASWGKDRTIRADLVRWTLTDPVASQYVHPSGIGIAGARIAGTLDLSYATVTLPITLLDCVIPDGLDLSFARIASIDLRRSWTGEIDAQQALIHGDVLLRLGHYDNVNFYRAEIDGDLDCSSGRFVGDDPVSMVLATIKGDAIFHEGFETSGLVDFRLAKVAQALSFNHARFTGNEVSGLNAERATVGGGLYWVDITLTPHTTLDLGSAHAGSLWDDAASWPTPGNLDITGFVYGDISGGPADADARLDWIHRQPRSDWAQPQPYRQLAMILRENGAEEGATQVEIARENAVTEYGGIPMSERIWRMGLRVTIGYGYRPLRALWWILMFVMIGTVLFRWAYRARLITPTEEAAYETFCATGEPPSHYPPFSSFIYSLENFLPVVDLHQGTYWRPNPRHRRAFDTRDQRRSQKRSDKRAVPRDKPIHLDDKPTAQEDYLSAAGTRTAIRAESIRETLPARFIRWYLWLHILAGWTVTPLLFAGLAGLLRNS
jgi:hypothetical protein